MENIKIIEIDFNPGRRDHVFGLPETLEIPIGTYVKWVIGDPRIYYRFFRSKLDSNLNVLNSEAIFTLYFAKTSPFSWNTESLRIGRHLRFSYKYFRPITIASGIAETPGNHKYGLKLKLNESEGNETPDYDDDPYLLVY